LRTMNKPTTNAPGGSEPPQGMKGFRLCSLFGIDIHLDASLLIIFTLIVFVLGNSVFPAWHAEWPTFTTWLTAAAAGVLFFASVLAHELAHSLVSRRFGIEVRRITLFLFGGIAEIREEPREPRAEFLIAIAGPVTSVALGLLYLTIATQLAGEELARQLVDDQKAALAALSPVATLFLWLGPVNIILGVFNLIPGFPLDGGRVLRALIWWMTGDLRRATQIATDCGRMFGWFLMAMGVVQGFSGGLAQGLWLVLIGWFLSNAASVSYKQLVVKDVLKGITARDMMRPRFEAVPPQMRLSEFIDGHLLQSAQQLWPVVDDGQLLGLVTLEEVRGVKREDRSVMTIGQVMKTRLGALTIAPDLDAASTIAMLDKQQSPLAVVEGGRVIGLITQRDAMKWLLLH
jgi:Zn-dependent protease/predicted transcriptional regulator